MYRKMFKVFRYMGENTVLNDKYMVVLILQRIHLWCRFKQIQAL